MQLSYVTANPRWNGVDPATSVQHWKARWLVGFRELVESMVRPAGIEPATYGFEARRSIQLSYGRNQTQHESCSGKTCQGCEKQVEPLPPRENLIGYLCDGLFLRLNGLIGSRLILRQTLPQHILNLIDERFSAGKRRPLRIRPNSLGNGLH